MEPLGRLEELIAGGVERLFNGAPAGPAEMLRAAAAALLRRRRRWFGHDLAPNRFEIRLAPAAHAEWAAVRRPLERELARRLAALAGEQGFDLIGPVVVALVADEAVAGGRLLVEARVAEADTAVDVTGPLTTPLGWRFTGHRPLPRLVLRELTPTGTHEHLVLFSDHAVVGAGHDGSRSGVILDLAPPAGWGATTTLLILAGRLFVHQPGPWRAQVVTRTAADEARPGAQLSLAPARAGAIRLARREGEVTSASVASNDWTLVLARGDLVIGRDPDTCDVVLVDDAVSARHARLVAAAECLAIEDLRSTNGLVVDGYRVAESRLGTGSHLRIGRTEVHVMM